MDPLFAAVVWPIAGAILAGGAIGLEREFRARAAGFRTHVLVCVASAVLMVCAVHQREWIGPFADDDIIRIDPVRMAHGILTGIGFLCGGVIFREGLSVHGLTTAATLWMVAAVGVLFGVGMYGAGAVTVALTLVVLTLFRVVDFYMPGRPMTEVLVRYRREGAPNESEFSTFLGKLALPNKRVTHRLTNGGEFMEYGTTIRSLNKRALQDLAQALCADARVVEYVLAPRDG